MIIFYIIIIIIRPIILGLLLGLCKSTKQQKLKNWH